MIYLIDDENKFMRRLAQRTFSTSFLTTEEKEKIESAKRVKEKLRSDGFINMLKEIHSRKPSPDKVNHKYLAMKAEEKKQRKRK